ncbi:acetamidase/formamidase [Jatrophihabitans sp. GAS493]|uniref:acetamidase/formamidase family protein n=1 Tax=Jatrophihabitans sp. GAS493 TaxID=1907575 RepID=UPI000BB71538|nr:acetamidase/formamidase family protein [Jatrophihabitans sp. GAS493]SOD70364.1 acetamidase/formamidase [Jatrophihabitans sp. GAS493]
MTVLQSGYGPMNADLMLDSRLDNISWGLLPNSGSRGVLSMRSGQSVCIDTVSHEGLLADQGRDPRAFFGAAGIASHLLLDDVLAIAASDLPHDPGSVGPHVVTGPIEVVGAQPGDVLEVEVLELLQRAPYGVISNRHGRGALPGELPAPPLGWVDGDPIDPVCLVARAEGDTGLLPVGDGRTIRFPLKPFLGIMGVAPGVSSPVNSVPPGRHGGNIDVNLLGVGARLFLPVQVPGAMFYVSDPHFAQGDGEVALTAFEAPLRATLRLTVHSDARAKRLASSLTAPWAETADLHIVLGLDQDLNAAMRDATRNSLRFLAETCSLPASVALAYLSAAADFEVSQVVDQVKGIHCCIRKSDLKSLG